MTKSKADVFDVAEYILSKVGNVSTWKLQKLVYYSQAWHLVWSGGVSLFSEKIYAWANGPVCEKLYQRHKGFYLVASIGGNTDRLTPSEIESIDAVLDFYGERDGQYLSDLTHMEAPWQKARKGLSPRERGNKPISLDSMAEYYGAL